VKSDKVLISLQSLRLGLRAIHPRFGREAVSREGLRASSHPRRAGRELIWLMAVKLAALFTLWALCFSPSHRTVADSDATGKRFALSPMAQDSTVHSRSSSKGVTTSQKGDAP
jgi:hypothetical protein